MVPRGRAPIGLIVTGLSIILAAPIADAFVVGTAMTADPVIEFGPTDNTEIGDLFMRRFEHYLERCIITGDAKDALKLQRLKMRLTRAYSGLWLMVHR